MKVCDAIRERRSARSFINEGVVLEVLSSLVDGARRAPSAANLQSLKYAIVADDGLCRELFPALKFAGYTPEWNPTLDERPRGLIVVLNDMAIRPSAKSECDAGIAMMSISLEAHELGLGSCIFGSINREMIREVLEIGAELDILYVIGLGYYKTENAAYDSSQTVKYHRDEMGNFIVPKRPLDDIIVFKK